MKIREDNSAQGEIIGYLPGTIPQPIPKKFLKKTSANQPLTKEETFGFADASAPSNSNYQTELSPTTTAEKKKMKRNKSIKERYERKLVELAQVCPECNNTGVKKQFGNNMLCTCTHGEDRRVDQENLMFKQARDMLGTGHTTAVKEETSSERPYVVVHTKKGRHETTASSSYEAAKKAAAHWKLKSTAGVSAYLADIKHVAESNAKVYDTPKRVVARRTSTTVGGEYKRVASGTKGTILTSGEGLGGKVHFIKWDGHKGTHAHRADDVKKLSEDIITSLDDVADILEAYKPSAKLQSRTKYLVQPKLSKMLQDRLAARKPAKKGYTPSARTLGLAAQRKAQMSKPKTPSPKGYPEEVKALDDVIDHPHKAHKKVPVKEAVDKFDAHFILRNTNSRGKDFHSLSRDQVDSLNHYAKQHNYRKSASAPGSTARMFHAHLHRLLGEESINELSKKTLGSYIKKAADHAVNKASEGGWKHGQYDYEKDYDTDKDSGESDDRKAVMRVKGIKKATDRLTKEDVSKKKSTLSAHVKGEEMSALSKKPMMGSSNNNRVSEAYSKDAVDKEIRKDKRIGGKEAKRIHALLKGRTHTPDKNANPPITKAEIMKRNGVKEETVNESWGEKHHSFKDFKDNAQEFANRNTHDGKVSWEHKEASVGGKTWHQSRAIVHDPVSNTPYVTGVFNHTHGPHSEEGHGQHLSRYSHFNEEVELLADGKSNGDLKKFTGDSKNALKRKYLGVIRGRTATGKPAHSIEVDPVVKTNTEVNKVVK